jgi:hypothetical protein
MVGAPIEFDFSEEWNGLGKTAVFRCDGERDVILGADKMYVVPHEILTTPGMDVEVGVYAVKEDGTTWPSPTPFCRIGRLEEGADPSGDESYPPTPDVGAQAIAAASTAMQAAAAAQEVAAEIQRRADAGEFDGRDGQNGKDGKDGYTPVKGVDYFDGKDGAAGADGKDYVLTEADKVEIAEIAADLVDVPEGGGSADLTGYATEEWVKSGYQPKGNYLTEVPAGYAKTEDIPTKPSDIGAQPAGNYATKSEIPTVPTKLSAFTNDAGFVTEDALENLGGKAYVQNTQPANMEEGEFWYNPDEEPEGGESSGSGSGAFALLADIDCSQVSGNIVLTDLADLTEIYVEWNGVQNSHASTASGYRLKINDVYLGIHQFIPIQKSGSSLYGWSYAKCVGVAWIAQRSAGAIGLDNEQLANGNAMFPYNTIKTGAANKLVFGAPDTQYQAVAGTIKIWGR